MDREEPQVRAVLWLFCFSALFVGRADAFGQNSFRDRPTATVGPSANDQVDPGPDKIVEVVTDAAITTITNIAELLCGEDSISPNITLKNNGTEPLTDVTITYGVAGGPTYLEQWSGSLQPGQTVNIALPSIPLIPGENVLSATSSAPNGGLDEVPENDTWTQTFTASLPVATVSLILTLDDYGSDITWELASGTGTVLYEGGPYTDFDNGFIDSTAFCLTNGCYTFTIHDIFGNGICCDEGDGQYVIRDLSGTVYAESDGQYGAMNTNEMCFSGVSVPEHADAGQLRISPNPSSGTFLLDLSSLASPTRYVVLDAVGRKVKESSLTSGQASVTLDLRNEPAAIYFLALEHATGRTVRRIVVER